MFNDLQENSNVAEVPGVNVLGFPESIPDLVNDPQKMTIADKISYERLYRYARKHYRRYLESMYGEDYFLPWENRAEVALALLNAEPPLEEIAMEILKGIDKIGWEGSGGAYNEERKRWVTRTESLYRLGCHAWEKDRDAQKALFYFDKALAELENSGLMASDRAEGEVFYARLKMLKELGQMEEIWQDIQRKKELYETTDGLSNSYMFFISLFQAEYARENRNIQEALQELSRGSKYFAQHIPREIKAIQKILAEGKNPEETYKELWEILKEYECRFWHYDGTSQTGAADRSLLYKAIESYNDSEALNLIKLNKIDGFGDSLALAVEHEMYDVVERLLRTGIDPNSDASAYTEPIGATLNEEVPPRILQMLLNFSPNTEVVQWNKSSLLRAVKRNCQPEKVALLLKAGAELERTGMQGETPLLAAVSQPEILHMLLSAGADIHHRDTDGNTALVRAAGAANWQSMELLWEFGAEKSPEALEQAFAEAVKGNTPTHLQVAKRLLDLGAVLKPEGRVYLRTPAKLGNIEMMGFLLNVGARVNDESNEEVSIEITDLQANPDRMYSREGTTPLAAAAKHGQINAMRLLLKCGAAVNHRDVYGMTPLHYASFAGEEKAADLLIEAGADIHAKNNQDKTAADLALQRGSYITWQVIDEALRFRKQSAAPEPALPWE